MKMKFKRIICSVLSILMIVSVFPVMAGAGTVDEVTFEAVEGTEGVSNENYPNLIDNKNDTKWCVSNFSSAYIIIKASEAVAVSGYSITTGNDSARNWGRNPRDWKLYGSNNYNSVSGDGTWTLIHEVENDILLPAKNTATVEYAFDTTEEYKYFKLYISENHTEGTGADCMQMSEFKLTDCSHTWSGETEIATSVNSVEHKVYKVNYCTSCYGIKSYEYLRTEQHSFVKARCSECNALNEKEMVDAFAEIDSFTTLPARYDYELGNDDYVYHYFGYASAYATLMKINITEQDIGKKLYLSLKGKNSYIETRVYLFRENGTSIEKVKALYSNLSYEIDKAGTYYIALAGYDDDDIGLCRAEVNLVEVKNTIESFKEIEEYSSIPTEFDYELGETNCIYSSPNGIEYDSYATLLKINVTEQDVENKCLYINAGGKEEYVDTYTYLYRQNGENIELVAEEDGESLVYNLEKAGTYYISLAGWKASSIGLCHAKIELLNKKTYVDAFKEIDTASEIPLELDYELGSENVIYFGSDPDMKAAYAKLLKVEAEAGKSLYVYFCGMNEYVDTCIYLYRQNGDNIELVKKENYGFGCIVYDIEEAGTYYIALAGGDIQSTGLSHAKINLFNKKDIIEGFKKIKTFTEIPAEFDYDPANDNFTYNDVYGGLVYAKLLKVNITDDNTLLDVSFAGKDRHINTYATLYVEVSGEIVPCYYCIGTDAEFYIPESGTYYLSLEVYPDDVGVCHGKVDSSVIDNFVSGCLDFTEDTLPVPEEGDLWNWDEATNTLTLKDGFKLVSSSNDGIIVPDNSTIIVEGKADVWSMSNGIYAEGNLTITGNGIDNSLLDIYSRNDGIRACGNFVIENCSLEITAYNNGLYDNREGCRLTIENSNIDIVSSNNGIWTDDAEMIITDSSIKIDARYYGEGMSVGNIGSNISVSGGSLTIASRYQVFCATDVILTDVNLDIGSLDRYYGLISLNDYSDFSLPGTLLMYDRDGNELYKGEWTQEMIDDDGYVSINDVHVCRIVSLPDEAPYIKNAVGKVGWDAINDEIADADSGDTIIVDMNGSTNIPKYILGGLKGKDVKLVLDMGNGFTWTIDGKKVTEPKDVDMSVDAESNIPIAIINKLTGECSYITITLAHEGDFGFEAVLSFDLGDDNQGKYANLYYYNESESDTEFITSGLIGSDGMVGLTFTHASEYVVVIDTYNHGENPGNNPGNDDIGAGDNSSNVKVPIIAAFLSLVSLGAVVSTGKRKNKLS